MVDVDQETRNLKNTYRTLLRSCGPGVGPEGKKEIRKAFNFALEAHKGIRRKSGELYIFHPLEVAIIVTKEVGLNTKSIVSSLLHDVVEDTNVTLEEIEGLFGKKVAQIIDGLTKISGFIGSPRSIQAENFRKIILTLSDDVRVILIKIADRLHNMRTLDALSKKKQLKISSETLELFAPLAHRLGLFSIKSELEDLSLKYTEPVIYHELQSKIKSNFEQIQRLTRTFMRPITESLKKMEIEVEVKARFKSIFSIYKKMNYQGIPFEKIYDLFAIRIIIDDSNDEKADCWRVYSTVTDFYKPNPERLRDWLSTPKVNGYESLHTTVMGPKGKWVEVQIRTRRMDEIAEKGYAAHWKYKSGSKTDSSLDEWIKKVGELLRGSDTNAVEFFDEFKMNLFSHEKYIFTPKGDLRILPANATALDFAFDIHTDVGLQCLGAKVNNKLVPLNYKLKNGDQVEIITSKKQLPSQEWLEYVITAKARSKIKQSIKEQSRNDAQKGREILLKKLKINKISENSSVIHRLLDYFQYQSEFNLYYNIGISTINVTDLNNAFKILNINKSATPRRSEKARSKKNANSSENKPDQIIVGEYSSIPYKMGKCCEPIPGDEIFGYLTIDEGIIIHRTNCPKGIELMASYGYRIVSASWGEVQNQEVDFFSVGIRFRGFDNKGLVAQIMDVISKEMQINMKSINVEAQKGTFTGTMIVEVYDTLHLENLINRIKEIEGIESVKRFHV